MSLLNSRSLSALSTPEAITARFEHRVASTGPSDGEVMPRFWASQLNGQTHPWHALSEPGVCWKGSLLACDLEGSTATGRAAADALDTSIPEASTACFVGLAVALCPRTNEIFAAGSVGSSLEPRWTVRRSRFRVRNASWLTVDSYMGFGAACMARDLAFDRSGGLYVAGYALDAATGWWHWIIRRSTDRGETWQVLETWRHRRVAGAPDVCGRV
jgi:hypothetical protein